jgi:hypothetical protein
MMLWFNYFKSKFCLLRRARPRCLLQIRADSTRRRPPLLLHRLLLRPAGFRCRLLPLPQCLPIAAVESTLFPTSSAASSTSRFSLVVHYRFCCNQPTLLSIYPAGHLKKNFVPRLVSTNLPSVLCLKAKMLYLCVMFVLCNVFLYFFP